ncbi:MAG: hypothetical protein JWN14_1520, partial [Chthonomonadales bacterium]|nr:hypothetical protein [Chthonomonadales bacterium]
LHGGGRFSEGDRHETGGETVPRNGMRCEVGRQTFRGIVNDREERSEAGKQSLLHSCESLLNARVRLAASHTSGSSVSFSDVGVK